MSSAMASRTSEGSSPPATARPLMRTVMMASSSFFQQVETVHASAAAEFVDQAGVLADRRRHL